MHAIHLADRVTLDPDICFEKPSIRGTRIRVVDILENLAGGATPEEIIADFPELELDDIAAALTYAAHVVERPSIPAD